MLVEIKRITKIIGCQVISGLFGDHFLNFRFFNTLDRETSIYLIRILLGGAKTHFQYLATMQHKYAWQSTEAFHVSPTFFPY